MGPDRGRGADLPAFERLIEGYTEPLFSIALRITGSVEDAEDATQDAVLSAYQSWAQFRGEARGSTWLYRIVVNAALQHVRRRHPQRRSDGYGYDERRSSIGRRI